MKKLRPMLRAPSSPGQRFMACLSTIICASCLDSEVATHIRNCRTPWIESVKWLIGDDLKMEIVCVPCANDRENGQPVDVEQVCEECYQYLTDEIVDLVGCRGKPGILIRHEIFNDTLKNNALPKQIGTVVDIAPINQERQSVWLMRVLAATQYR
jgi:hypothetical protein